MVQMTGAFDVLACDRSRFVSKGANLLEIPSYVLHWFAPENRGVLHSVPGEEIERIEHIVVKIPPVQFVGTLDA